MESFDITPDLKMKLNKAQRARVALEQAVFDFVDERFHGTIDATTRNAHQWKRACDLMFGHNYCWKQWEVGLSLAMQCQHEDALWLQQHVEKRGGINHFLTASESARPDLFKGDDDVRAATFAALCSNYNDMLVQLKVVAQRGYGFAQGRLADRSNGEEKVFWARRAALQGDPSGCSTLGRCLLYGWGVAVDAEEGRTWVRKAAQLNDVDAFRALAEGGFGAKKHNYDARHCFLQFSGRHPELFYWLGKASAIGQSAGDSSYTFCWMARDVVKQYKVDAQVFGPVVFEIGRVLDHLVGDKLEGATMIFGYSRDEATMSALNQARVMYKAWVKVAERAATCWMLCSKYLPVSRDIAKIIGVLVWASRCEAIGEVIEDDPKVF